MLFFPSLTDSEGGVVPGWDTWPPVSLERDLLRQHTAALGQLGQGTPNVSQFSSLEGHAASSVVSVFRVNSTEFFIDMLQKEGP